MAQKASKKEDQALSNFEIIAKLDNSKNLFVNNRSNSHK